PSPTRLLPAPEADTPAVPFHLQTRYGRHPVPLLEVHPEKGRSPPHGAVQTRLETRHLPRHPGRRGGVGGPRPEYFARQLHRSSPGTPTPAAASETRDGTAASRDRCPSSYGPHPGNRAAPLAVTWPGPGSRKFERVPGVRRE